MLGLRPNCHRKPSRLAAKNRRFSSLGPTPEGAARLFSQFLADGKGCAVSVGQPLLAVLRNRKLRGAAAKLPTMNAYAKRFGNSRRMSTCVQGLATILKSAVAENVGGVSLPATSRPLTAARSTHFESYRCTKLQSNSLGMISLQKKVGGTPLPEVIH